MRGSGRLTQNIALLYGAEVVGKLLGFAVFAYLSHVLAKTRYGDLEGALAFLFIFNLVIEAGLGPWGAREASKDPGRAPLLLSQVFAVRGALALVSAVALVAIALASDRDGVARTLVALHALVLLPVPLLLNWAFQARDEMGVVALTNLGRQVLLAAGVYAFVRSSDDVLYVPVVDACGYGLCVLAQRIAYGRRVGRPVPLRALHGLRDVVRDASPIAVSSCVWALRLFAPTIALWLFTTSDEVAPYGAAHRIVVAAHTFVWLYFFALLPSLSRAAVDADTGAFRRVLGASLTLIAWAAVAAATCGTLVAGELTRRIYDPRIGEPAGALFALMVWMLAAAFVSGHQRFGLIAYGKQRHELLANLAGATVSVGACLVLRERLTPETAAAVFVAAEVVTLVAAHLLFVRVVHPLPLRPVLVPLAVAAALLGAAHVAALPPLVATAGAAVLLAALTPLVVRRPRQLLADLQSCVRPTGG